MKNKLILRLLVLAISFVILQNNFGIAAQSTVCAEHTIYGAWCQDVPASQADPAYRISQTACQSTTYCSMGTCVNNQTTQTCVKSPQATCNSVQGGVWYSTTPSNTPVCRMGCCFIGDQASFTTQAACLSFASIYSVNTTFDRSINNELDCISSAYPQAKGACVYNTDTGRTCKFTTRQNCKQITGANFKQDFLCTNPTLGTNCAMTTNTMCSATSDKVYFMDSCGNQANVYDANKVKDVLYWSYTAGTNGVSVDVGDGQGNIESATNGNCNYLSGSTCMAYNRNIDKSQPSYGTNICRSVNCDSSTDSFAQLFKDTWGAGRTPNNGESWCGTETVDSNGNPIIQLEIGGNPGIALTAGSTLTTSSYSKAGNTPGSTEVLFSCNNGQITPQVGGQYRNKICVQNSTTISNRGTFYSAAFIGNRWGDCWLQNTSKDCQNTDQRDCQWIVGASVQKDASGNPLVWDKSQDALVPSSGKNDTRQEASCIPKYPSGFDTTTSNTCAAASRICYVNYTQSPTDAITGYWRVDTSNAQITCLDNYNDPNKPPIISNWQSSLSNLCQAQGDCGISVNYVNTQGANDNNKIFTVVVGNQTGEKIGF